MDGKIANELLMLRREAESLAATHEPSVDPKSTRASRTHRFMKLGDLATSSDAHKHERPGNGNGISRFVEYRRILPFALGVELHLVAAASKISSSQGEYHRIDSIETRLMEANAPDTDPLTVEAVSLAEVSLTTGDSKIELETLQKLAGIEETVHTAQIYSDFLNAD
jgi:Fe-S-cluster formation regulator IscX/YfhJ